MPGLPTAAFRAVGQDDAIPDGFVVPFYLSDRKLRISVARAGGRRDRTRRRRSTGRRRPPSDPEPSRAPLRTSRRGPGR